MLPAQPIYKVKYGSSDVISKLNCFTCELILYLHFWQYHVILYIYVYVCYLIYTSFGWSYSSIPLWTFIFLFKNNNENRLQMFTHFNESHYLCVHIGYTYILYISNSLIAFKIYVYLSIKVYICIHNHKYIYKHTFCLQLFICHFFSVFSRCLSINHTLYP